MDTDTLSSYEGDDSLRGCYGQVQAALGKGCAAGVKLNMGLVHDILCNAERRLQHRQYDNAVDESIAP